MSPKKKPARARAASAEEGTPESRSPDRNRAPIAESEAMQEVKTAYGPQSDEFTDDDKE